MKSWIRGHRIHKLGCTADLAWIRSNGAIWQNSQSDGILCHSIQVLIEISFQFFSTDCVIQCNLIIRLYHIVGIQKLGTCSDNINVHLYAFYFFPCIVYLYSFWFFKLSCVSTFFSKTFFLWDKLIAKILHYTV